MRYICAQIIFINSIDTTIIKAYAMCVGENLAAELIDKQLYLSINISILSVIVIIQFILLRVCRQRVMIYLPGKGERSNGKDYFHGRSS